MNRFSQLPEMKSKPENELVSEFDEQMQCGGCGSKVSADLLEEVLTEMTGIEAPRDDAAVYSVPEGQLLLQTVDRCRPRWSAPSRGSNWLRRV